MKLLIRERASCNNGVFDEHLFYGGSANGSHPISKVGWCKVHTLTTDRLAFTPKNTGSLHFDLEENRLYVIDSDGNFMVLATNSHNELTNLDVDADHTQYYLKDNTRPIASEIHLVAADALEVTDFNSNAGSALPETHRDLSWLIAHPVPNAAIVARHLSAGSISRGNFSSEAGIYSYVGSPTYMVKVPTDNYLFWPRALSTGFPTGYPIYFSDAGSGNCGLYSSTDPQVWGYKIKS
jgi:hypothetical protein